MAAEIRQLIAPIRDRLKKALADAEELIPLPANEVEARIKTFRDMETKVARYNDSYHSRYDQWISIAKGDAAETQLINDDLLAHQSTIFSVDDCFVFLSSAIKAVELDQQKRERQALQQKELDLKAQLWTAQAQATSPSTVKLPELTLVKFDGNVHNWQSFWNSFKASVDDNPKLPAVEKMAYLKSQLIGSAASSIGGLSVTASNYPIALQLLSEQFGDKQVLINAHYTALSELPRAPHQKDLRPIFDQLEIHFHSLSALGGDVNHRQLATLIRSKLPSSLLLQLFKEQGTNNWDPKTWRQHIRTHLHQCDSVYDNRAWRKPWTTTNRSSSGTSSLIATVQSRQCAFCEETTHWSTDCNEYPTAQVRAQRISGNCLVCLSRHQGQCRRTKPCFFCNVSGDHHTSLCPTKFGTLDGTIPASLVCTAPEPAVVIKSTSAITTHEGNVNTLLASGTTVHLQTATATIQSPEGQSAKTRLLLDCGSHRSFMSEKLAKVLKLKPRRTETISVGTFMDSHQQHISTPVVDVSIQLADKTSLPISVNVIPIITGGVQRAPASFQQLRPLYRAFEMADSMPQTNETVEIDLLLGNDYYGEIMTAERVSLMKGLYLLGSKLGWILSGRMLPDSMVKNQRNISSIDDNPNDRNTVKRSIPPDPGIRHQQRRKKPPDK